MEQKIAAALTDNLSRIKETFSDCQDIHFHRWNYGPDLKHQAFSVFCTSLIQDVQTNFFRSTLKDLVGDDLGPDESITPGDIIRYFGNHGVSAKSATTIDRYQDAVDRVMDGFVVIFIDEWDRAIAYCALSVAKRAVEDPISEPVVQGPREGTVERLDTNLGMLRERIKTHQLKVEFRVTGTDTKSKVAFAYLAHLVDPDTLTEFRRKIEGIEQNEVLETAYVEEWIEDCSYSPMPQCRYTERTDSAAAALLAGKIIVLVQNTPMILICPALFVEFFGSSEDYYQRTLFSTLIRQLRIIAFFIALTLPSIYVALSTFHPELIPSVLLLANLDTREGIPFPVFVEALIMEISFELLREAGIRLPRPVGSAVSIVGALVIGQAAIQAKIASPIMVIVVALTGIASFAIPHYNIAIALRVLRFPLMVMASILGGFGVMIGFLWILLHMCHLQSLGVPYMKSLSPIRFNDLKDVFIRIPLKQLVRSPRHRRTQGDS
jgi:hypothetical protein